MVRVKPLDQSADKFERRASAAGADYRTGVESVSDADQQDATVQAASAWEQGVQDAISDGRFSSGVTNPKRSWQQAALEDGESRFTQGAGNAGQRWSDRFAPFADTLEGLTLQPRGPRGSASNFDRARAVGEALHDARQ